MRRSGFLRLPLLALALIGVNFGGFAYAHLARSTAGNPFFGNQANADGLFPAYLVYWQQLTTAIPNEEFKGASVGFQGRQS